MTVVFYISAHGFGHASRDVEVLNAFGALMPGVRLLIRSSVSPLLLERTMRVPYELRPGACDSGMIQSSSLVHDDDATTREAIRFHESLDARARAEADVLSADHVAVIVGDIPALAFEVAEGLHVPSVAIGNFTWDWIYETHPGLTERAPWLVPRLRAAYAKATLALELPFSGGFEVFRDVRRLPFIARMPTRTGPETRRILGLPADRRIALLSFGGYGLPALDLRSVDCLDAWTVVTTDRVLHSGSRALPREVIRIEEDRFFATGLQYPDLVAAADVVMTKPGYGIVSECIAGDRPMLYTSRGQFREYDQFVREMPDYLRCRFISQDDLFAGRWRAALEGLVEQAPTPKTARTGGAAEAALAIWRMLPAASPGWN